MGIEVEIKEENSWNRIIIKKYNRIIVLNKMLDKVEVDKKMVNNEKWRRWSYLIR